MDTLTPQARSELMGRIKAKGTAPERALREALREAGLRPSRAGAPLPGKPDVAFRSAKVAVFVDGCYWHGCPLHARLPTGDSAPYWMAKIASNMERDARVDEELEAMGWMSIRLWEHELKGAGGARACAQRVADAIEARR